MADCALRTRLLAVGAHHGFCHCPPDAIPRCTGCGVELFGAQPGNVCLACACAHPELLTLHLVNR